MLVVLLIEYEAARLGHVTAEVWARAAQKSRHSQVLFTSWCGSLKHKPLVSSPFSVAICPDRLVLHRVGDGNLTATHCMASSSDI